MGRDKVQASIEDLCCRLLVRKEERKEALEATFRCLKKGYDYDKLRDRLTRCIADQHRASRLVTALAEAVPQFKKKTKFAETTNMSEEQRGLRETAEKYKKEGILGERLERSKNRKEQESEQKDGDEKKPSLEEMRTKELMYQAQQAIEERKRLLQIGGAGAMSTPETDVMPIGLRTARIDRSSAQQYVNLSMDKKSRVEELKAKLARTPALQKLQQISDQAKVTTGVQPSTSFLNKPARPQVVDKVLAPLSGTTAAAQSQQPPEMPELSALYEDPRVATRSAKRTTRKTFAFHERGEFVTQANKMRAKARLERLQAAVAESAKKTGISTAVKLAMVTPQSAAAMATHSVPPIEWWDELLLDGQGYDAIASTTDDQRYMKTVTDLVEHPIQLRAGNDPLHPQYIKVYLTKREQKKLRRQNRKEAQKEVTEKIRLGLMKPPEPKVRLANLMRVLGNEAIQDPTKMEAHVRAQVAERLKKHEHENAARKLTKEQRVQKKTKKLAEDTMLAVHVAVYRVRSLQNPAKKFKVEMNAKQLKMTGLAILHKDLNLVIVEGGPKQQKFFKNLMLTRIKWADEVIGEKKNLVVTDKDAPGERNFCKLLWEGSVKRRAFERDFKSVSVTLEKQARELLDKAGVAHYWDVAYSTAVLHEGCSA